MGKKWLQSPKVGGEPFCAIAFSTMNQPSAEQRARPTMTWKVALLLWLFKVFTIHSPSVSHRFSEEQFSSFRQRKCCWLSTVDGGSKNERKGDDSVGTTKLYCVFIQPVDDDRLMDEGERGRG